ncbi:D-alanyl-D-alanine carboxypeptidase family protein [Miniphocaeibacter massiliensis]|uniref:D-alanyl-D-alanine carboxypeptidase family protein n=1 Tax=Miniphocaeibacter massiliensis TaxID=2041841 RepID=UPI000C1C1B85|nr:D-alanyl-D-alanine carboxypeptidase family protein [Miniphocaeibacter massiliensis]
MKKIKHILAFILLFIFTYPNIALASMDNFEDKTKGYMIGEVTTDTIINSYNEEEVLPIASITKVMTYIIVKEALDKGTIKLTDTVPVTDDIQAVDGSSLLLEVGEVPTVDELIKGLIVISGNDAAYALAKKISGSEEKFVELMNNKAKEIGLTTAKFVNSHGLPDSITKEENTMSVKDVYTMSKYAIEKHPEILKLSSTISLDFPNLEFKRESTIPFIKTIPGVDGLKTGTTDEAGFCLVSTFKPIKNEKIKDFRFISVVMGAETKEIREEVTENIINYTSSNYNYAEIVKEDELYDIVKLNKVSNGKIETYPSEKLELLYDESEGIKVNKNIKKDIELPLKKGDSIGALSIKANNGKVYNVDLIVKEDYEAASFGTRVKRFVSNIFDTSATLLGF